MPRLSVQDGQDPIDAAIEAAEGAQADDFTSASTSEDDSTTLPDFSGSEGADSTTQQQQQPGAGQSQTTQSNQQTGQQRGGDTQTQPGTQQQQQPAGTGDRQALDGQQQQQQRQQQAERQFGQRVRDDGRGNFVDEKGKVVARAGAERRLYESARRLENDLVNERSTVQRAAQAVQHLQGQLRQAEQRVQQIQQQQPQEHEAITTARRSGLQDNEIALGVDIVSQLKTNPIQGVRRVLQTALSQGYNIKDILGADAQGNIDASGIDMSAVKQMIDTQLAPFTEQQRREQQQQEQQRQSQEAYRQFVQTHPYSDVHMQLITDYVQRNPNLSAEGAYYEIKMFATQNGLDFSQPLGPQVAARSQQQQPGMQQQQQQQMPLPNGTGVNANNATQPHNASANASDDWDSIIESSMRESGMQF